MFKRIKYAFARAFGSAKYAWKLIRYNGKTVTRFMVIYTALSMFAFATIFTVLFQITLKMAGIPALTPDTFLTWILSGSTIICAVLLLLLFAGITTYGKETLDGADYSGGIMKFVRMYMLNQQ